MPYHLGMPPEQQPSEQLPSSTGDLKRQLAVKEQDLYYTKRENSRLTQELEELKQNGNFEALRKEMEINEKLTKELEMFKNTVD